MAHDQRIDSEILLALLLAHDRGCGCAARADGASGAVEVKSMSEAPFKPFDYLKLDLADDQDLFEAIVGRAENEAVQFRRRDAHYLVNYVYHLREEHERLRADLDSVRCIGHAFTREAEALEVREENERLRAALSNAQRRTCSSHCNDGADEGIHHQWCDEYRAALEPKP